MFRQVIRLNRRSHTFERPVGSPSGERNSFGGVPREGEPDTFEQEIWLYAPQHNYLQDEFGVRLSGDLNGLAIPTEYETCSEFGLEENDRVEHGGIKYAVQTITYLPNEEDRQIVAVEFTRMEHEP